MEAISGGSEPATKSVPAKRSLAMATGQHRRLAADRHRRREIHLQAAHGLWGGYHYPKALAYAFDVGVDSSNSRIRVRQRGNQWRAFGCVIDFATAKHIAQQAVENPSEPRPSKFNIPLNLVGGERRRPGSPTLDSQTREYVQHVEFGVVKVDAPNERPTSGDDKSINLCATNDEVEEQRAGDWADESLDESLYVTADGKRLRTEPVSETGNYRCAGHPHDDDEWMFDEAAP